ncbi:hypothetical protein KC19_2G070800 [Ceratodon purpureus]|uniref:Uncharacterized protein n=1 Tax=Ceratodon purpureus TaxID=3225 RepID=A0A8T0ISN7_CERPU|nr:hypothetical protein KC19_2G070800 [Ceratodon purpureus]
MIECLRSSESQQCHQYHECMTKPTTWAPAPKVRPLRRRPWMSWAVTSNDLCPDRPAMMSPWSWTSNDLDRDPPATAPAAQCSAVMMLVDLCTHRPSFRFAGSFWDASWLSA